MTQLFKKFFKGEDGAITVDWVVLTAATVGLAGGLGVTMLDGIESATNRTSTKISTKSVNNGD